MLSSKIIAALAVAGALAVAASPADARFAGGGGMRGGGGIHMGGGGVHMGGGGGGGMRFGGGNFGHRRGNGGLAAGLALGALGAGLAYSPIPTTAMTTRTLMETATCRSATGGMAAGIGAKSTLAEDRDRVLVDDPGDRLGPSSFCGAMISENPASQKEKGGPAHRRSLLSLERHCWPAVHSALLFALPGLLRVLAALMACATLLLPALPVRVMLPALLLPAAAVLSVLLLAALSGIAFRRHTTRIVRIIHRVLLVFSRSPLKQRLLFRIVPSVRRGGVNSLAGTCNQRRSSAIPISIGDFGGLR